jgi:hypothetical protein
MANGVSVMSYHSDNGIYSSKEFMKKTPQQRTRHQVQRCECAVSRQSGRERHQDCYTEGTYHDATRGNALAGICRAASMANDTKACSILTQSHAKTRDRPIVNRNLHLYQTQ